MSINHFSSSDLPEAQWWSHYTTPPNTSSSIIPNSPARFYFPGTAPMFCSQNAAACFDLNNEDEEELADNESERVIEHETAKVLLFEKPLTPSDVGKLNRLVIPKQHAEKHFPLNGVESGENGLLLGFEDEIGKSWRFRYSYWNSSQSYVLTKGWSRFVKEKRLDAGDIVVFARDRVDTGRLFIGWRRRNSGGGHESGGGSQPVVSGGGGGGWGRVFYSGSPYPIQQQGASSSLVYQPEILHAGSNIQNQTTTTTAGGGGGGSGNSKRLRLFGVNLELECEAAAAADDSELEPSSTTTVGSPVSSSNIGHHQLLHLHHPYHQFYTNNHMDISFSGAEDVYRQG